MSLFRYQAVDGNGETVQDQMEASSRDDLISLLRHKELLPLDIREVSSSGWSLTGLFSGFGGSKISRDELNALTRQLADLLKAGLPLDRAFTVLIELAEEGDYKKLLARIQEKVRSGSTLADAMESQGRTFNRFYLNMIRAGEMAGSIDAVMARLTDYLDKSKELRESVTSALIYPMILFFVSGASVIILLAYVVPQFQQMFSDAGKALPLATQIVITIGDGLQQYWWVGLLVMLLMLVVMQKQMQNPASRQRWDGWFLRWPLCGELIAKVETARFSRTLGSLLENGVSLVTALTIVRETMGNRVLAEAVGQAEESLKAGQGLSEPLMEGRQFPKLAIHMIRVGEETGQLQEMLLRIADTFDSEVQITIKRMLALLEPVMILGLGIIIAGIIMSILVAILSLNNLAM